MVGVGEFAQFDGSAVFDDDHDADAVGCPLTSPQITTTIMAMESTRMIFWNFLSLATSISTNGSEKLPEIAKTLAPVVRVAMETLRRFDEICLNSSTGLVAVGVFLEFFEIRHQLWGEIWAIQDTSS